MTLLKKAIVEQVAAKVGIFGPQGSGKTTTAALILLGMSKVYHQGAPVAFLDTENGSDYLVPIFEAEGVELLVVKSRAFTDMKGALREAEEAKCCGYLVDSYTHPWQELNDSLKKQLRVSRLEFNHMDQLKGMWRAWTDLMLNSPLHVILSGRLGYVWDRQEDANGNKQNGELVKLGTKMKSESEAGYEPSLLIEMEGIQTEAARARKTHSKKGSIVHHAYVLKDRWRTLNGRVFTFADLNSYKAGDYKKVFDTFKPHFEKLAIGKSVEQRAVDPSRTSAAMFDGTGDSAYQQRVRRVHITLEEIEGTLLKLWPGQDAKSKALKALAVETLWKTRSWKAVESKPLEQLVSGLEALRLFEEQATNGSEGNALVEPVAAAALLEMCAAKLADEVNEAVENAVL
jgi:hypothetical protein